MTVELTTLFTYSIIIIKYITKINIHIHNEHIYLENMDISIPTKYANFLSKTQVYPSYIIINLYKVFIINIQLVYNTIQKEL